MDNILGHTEENLEPGLKVDTDLGTAFDHLGNENMDDLSSVDDDLVDLDLPLDNLEDSDWPDDSFDCD